jgi:hypothetical protein
VREQLDRLAAGDFPDLMTWVRRYGRDGAMLVRQPDAIWEHPRSTAVQTDEGGWHVVLPLWTTNESPSDLSAEVLVAADGTAVVHDVHVL